MPRFNPFTTDRVTHCEFFGANPGASAIVNTNAIQTALNKTGRVWLTKPGTYQINAPLNISSNTSFELGEGVTIQLAPQSNCVMIQNINYNNTGATDSYIKICGGVWDGNGANQTRQDTTHGQGTPLVTWYGNLCQFLNFGHLEFTDLTLRNPCSFGTYFGNGTDLRVENIFLDYGASPGLNTDGIHIQSMTNFVIRRIKGNTGDDMIALNADDYGVYNAAPGAIHGGLVEDIEGDNCYRHVRLLSATNQLYDVTVRGIKGQTQHSAVFFSNLQPYSIAGNSNIYDIVIEDIKTTTNTANEAVIYFDTNVHNVIVDGVQRNQSGTLSYLETITVASGYTVDSLAISNVQVVDSTSNGLSDIRVIGTVTNLNVSNFDRFNSGTAVSKGNAILVDGGTVTNLNVSNMTVNQTGTYLYVRNGGKISYANFNDVILKSIGSTGFWIGNATIDTSSGGTIHLNNIAMHAVPTCLNIESASTTATRFKISNFHTDGQTTLWSKSGTMSVSLVTTAFQVDVSTLNPLSGDVCGNNKTSTTTGPAYYNGTHWISMVDGTQIA